MTNNWLIVDVIPKTEDLRRDADLFDIAKDYGIVNIEKWTRYYIYGDIKDSDQSVILDALHDPIADDVLVYKEYPYKKGIIEIGYLPGVMDTVAITVEELLKELNITITKVFTSRIYKIEGTVPEEIKKQMYNPLIEHFVDSLPSITIPTIEFSLREVDLSGDLLKISKDMTLSLNKEEMKIIKEYFDREGRNPTDIELETIAQTWSEHCQHKTLKGDVEYNGEIIKGLLQSTIVKATEEVKKDWCVSLFKDNAGIIEFDDEYNVCFKVETHNHPSALEPYGGAGTGIGGVIRDILGTGLGAKPVANTDIFCFASPDKKDIPEGTLHPKRIIKGVVRGVRDYGNRMGIPTINGSVYFHDSYVGNPLVYAGCVGIQKKEFSFKSPNTGDFVVVVGGRTGRDGIHGATFSSASLDEESESVSGSSVQIGNPIEEKKLLDAIMEAQEKRLYTAITDCGAGGLSSAVGEMGEELGVDVYLEKVPLKYSGLTYTEIWISESQERMVLSVPKDKAEELKNIMFKHDVTMAIIGEFTDTKRLKLFYNDKKVGDIDMKFLHKGFPKSYKKAIYKEPKRNKESFVNKDVERTVKKMFLHRDVASKEWITRQYDHEVQGGSVIKPLMGEYTAPCPSDGAVIRPLLDRKKGVVLSNGYNPRFASISPYYMAKASVDEAVRNIVATGGNINHTAILDNYSWGNPENPEVMGSLVVASKGAYEAAILFGTPYISGKDSLYNEYVTKQGKINILPTLVISALSVIDDINYAIRPGFKKEGELICITGKTYKETGGSLFNEIWDIDEGILPDLRADARERFTLFYKLVKNKIVTAAHDCSEGGLLVSLLEMGFCKNIGAKIDIMAIPQEDGMSYLDILFSESLSRVIFTINKEDLAKTKEIMGDNFSVIGKTGGNILEVKDNKFDIREIQNIWRKGIWQN